VEVVRGWLSAAQCDELVALAWGLPDGRVVPDNGSLTRHLKDSDAWPGWLADKLGELATGNLKPVGHVVFYEAGGFHPVHHDQVAPADWLEGGYLPPTRSVSSPLRQAPEDSGCLLVAGLPVETDQGDMVSFPSGTEHEVVPLHEWRAALICFMYDVPEVRRQEDLPGAVNRPWPAKRRRLTVVAGEPSAGKTSMLRDAWQRGLDESRPTFVVCPAVVAPGFDRGLFPWPDDDALLVSDEPGYRLPDSYIETLMARSRPHELICAVSMSELHRFDRWSPDTTDLAPFAGVDATDPDPAPAGWGHLVKPVPGAGLTLIHPLAPAVWEAGEVDGGRLERWANILEPVCVTGGLAGWVWATSALAKPHPVGYGAGY